MKKILFIFISISNLFLASSLFSQQLNNNDALELLLDNEWTKEFQSLTRIFHDATKIIEYQNQQQSEISNLVTIYLESDQMTNDELWENLDNILIQTDIYSENLNDQVSNLKINSSSSNINATNMYKDFLSLIYDLNDYSIDNNKLTKDLIDHLSENEIEQYDYKVARSYLRTADFLELMARTNRANASILPSRNLNRAALMLDSQILEYTSIATRVNGYQIMGELNKSLLKTYKGRLDRSYQKIQNGELYRDLISSIDYMNSMKKEIQSPNIDASELIDTIDELTINAKLYIDANLRQVDLWKELMDFYYRNSDYLDDLYADNSRNTEFTEIQARQEFEMMHGSKYSDQYMEASIKFTKIFPEYTSEFRKKRTY